MAPNGKVFHAGPSVSMHWIDTAGGGSITAAFDRGDDTDSMNGNAVMYEIGKILKIGGMYFHLIKLCFTSNGALESNDLLSFA